MVNPDSFVLFLMFVFVLTFRSVAVSLVWTSFSISAEDFYKRSVSFGMETKKIVFICFALSVA